jgi:hypothetical protein
MGMNDNPPAIMIQGNAQYAGDHGRIDYTGGGMSEMASGLSEAGAQPGYAREHPPIVGSMGTTMLLSHGGDSLTIIDPVHKEYWPNRKPEWDQPSTDKTMLNDSNANVQTAVQRLQPDSAIEGHAVQRWRVTTSYTNRNTFAGQTTTTAVKQISDRYIATDFMRDVGNPMGRGGPMSAAEAQLPKGMLLLAVTMGTFVDEHGKQTKMTMIIRVSHIVAGDVPPSAFAVPPGYTAKFEAPVTKVAGRDTSSRYRKMMDSMLTTIRSDAATSAHDKLKQKIQRMLHVP